MDLIDIFGCHVYGFDPTPRAIAHAKKVAGENPKYHFFDIGLWDAEDTLEFFAPKNPEHVSHSLLNLQKTEDHILINVKRLSCLMKELGHQKIDLLKIDIEGAEYKVIDSILEDDIDVGIICVEYDECFNPLDAEYRHRIKNSINSLVNNGYSLVCSQGNGNYTFVKNASSGKAGCLARPPGRRTRSPASSSHRTSRADFPHDALRRMSDSLHGECL